MTLPTPGTADAPTTPPASPDEANRPPTDSLASQCDALRAQLALCRGVLEEVRPIVKARLIDMDDLRAPLCDGSILDRIEQALKGGV